MIIVHKLKSGFTLFELLIVISILAVLVAIAIPTIAGLVDKAKISADTKEADEITNAMERFASEYELYKQDIATGTLDLSNLNSSQSRVYNSIKIASMQELQLLEGVGLNGNKIDKDTKYPINSSLINTVINNYTKREVVYVAPRQEDYHYYFSPDIGITVFADVTKSSTQELNSLVLSGNDANGNSLDNDTVWIDITYNSENIVNHSGDMIPKGATYISKTGQVYTEGMKFPVLRVGDIYTYSDYEYRYNSAASTWSNCDLAGWDINIISDGRRYEQETFESPLSYINGEPVTIAKQTFLNATKLKYAPKMPDTIVDMTQTFNGCTALEYCPDLPNGTLLLVQTFHNCKALKTPPKISANVEDMFICFGQSGITTLPDLRHCTKLVNLRSAFYDCLNLTDASDFYIPKTVTNCKSMLLGAKNLIKAPVIPSNVRDISSIYKDCTKLSGAVIINSSSLNSYTNALQYSNVTDVQGDIPNELKEAILATR